MSGKDPTRLLTGCGSDDFCLIHGYEHMRSEIGNPIPFCLACVNEPSEVTVRKMRDEWSPDQ